MADGFLKMSDGAYIHYRTEGGGRPILLVHGWSVSGRFFAKNVEALKETYRMVTIDLRGHGLSSKGMQGYTIDRLAADVHEVVEALALENVMLMGWSMGGPILLSYWKQFGAEKGRLAGLGLIDITPHPFSAEAWNCHSMRNYNVAAFNAFAKAYAADREGFARAFLANTFGDRKLPAEDAWMLEEAAILPTHIGIALYSEYVFGDYTGVLPTIAVPTLVMNGNSGIFPKSLEAGQWIAGQIPKGEFVPFHRGGHMLFYVESEKFNAEVRRFMARLA